MSLSRPLFGFLAGVALVGGLWFLTSREGGGGADSPGAAAGPMSTFGDGVGERVADLEYVDLEGREGRLSTLLEEASAVVVAMRDLNCPVCRKYGPELSRIEGEFAGRGVRFVFLNVNVDDEASEVRSDEVGAFGFTGSYVLDPEGERLAALLGPRSTTEVFVIDGRRTLRYRGAIDDQYGIDFAKPEARQRFLRDALDAVLDGEEVEVTESFPSGCLLGVELGPMPMAREITYHNRVSRILQQNCVTCHREAGVAPFSLEEYSNVFAYRAMIDFMVSDHRMPPWFAGEASVGTFANERRLPDRDMEDLLAWVRAGAPEGDAQDAPEPRRFAEGWNIGEPDAVVQIEEPVEVPAEGVVDYKYVYVKTDFDEDKWVERMQILPTASQVTHHVLVFIEPPGAKSAREAEPGEPVFQGGAGGFFGWFVPGAIGNYFPEGTAKRLPKGAWLKFQLHYTPNGEPAVDQSKIGFVFADGPPSDTVVTHSAVNVRLRIPPGASDHVEVAEYTFREPGRILTFMPHMHVRGKAFRYELVYPNGESETILDIPRYDFNWQLNYELAEPLRVPVGTVVRATAVFDNSADNPFNPDPTAEVRFGEQTFDEMLIGYFDWIPDRRAEIESSERLPR